MKKMYLFAAVVIAAVAGTICYNHESDSQMSDLAKKNAKALANDDLDKECIESPKSTCLVGLVTPDDATIIPFKDKRNPMEIVD